ncbi:MAG: hypothetical protein MJ146_01050 [Clostridia bacterium]|nr:hypothetical protein [Clostridia bacterium]
MKKIIVPIILVLILFTSCTAISYEPPENAPYKDIPVCELSSYSTSFSFGFKHTKFSVKVKLDENATYTDDYFIEWSENSDGHFELIEPKTDKPKTNGKEYNIFAGKKEKIVFDIDSYYHKLPKYGTYHFVKIFKVDGKDQLVMFEINMDNNDD